MDVKFTRRNYENIQTKAQVLDVMLKNDKIDPTLAFTSCGMFSDPEDAAKKSAEHYAKVKAEMAKQQTPPDVTPKAGDSVA